MPKQTKETKDMSSEKIVEKKTKKEKSETPIVPKEKKEKKETTPKEKKPKEKKEAKETKETKEKKPKEKKEDEAPKVPKERKPRRVVSSETVTETLTKMTEFVAAIDDKKLNKPLIKLINSLKSDTEKLFKKKKPAVKRSVTNSGFYKQVPITGDLAKFMACKPDEKKSRVDVTRFICKYIKEKNLPDQQNRKNILPDPALKNLLGHDAKLGPLTYPGVQKLIQQHFIKEKPQQ